MELLQAIAGFFADPANYAGTSGILYRLYQHTYMSAGAVLLAAALALPVGLYIGHARRAEFLAVSVGNLGRALPSFGVLGLVFPFTLEYVTFGSIGGPPTLIALVLLAIPPVLTNAYVGVKGVDRDAVEAARGMGMTERELLATLEVPLAMPLIVAGLRTAAVQVVATATLGAVAGWGGLGRYIIDGFAQGDRVLLVAGALLVALLAIVTEVAFTALQRAVAPAGMRERAHFGRAAPPEAEAAT